VKSKKLLTSIDMKIISIRRENNPLPLELIEQIDVLSISKEEYSSLYVEPENILILPTIMNIDSALSYDGVRFALNIYLDYINTNVEKFSIVLLSSESKASFYTHCDYANFLKCPNVYFVQSNLHAISEWIHKHEIKSLKKSDAILHLKSIKLPPPVAFGSHHSIINEWSIYKWSKNLGLSDIRISSEIENELYFKHLTTIYDLHANMGTGDIPSMPAGKVLLIDDEADKGWKDLFTAFFSNSKTQFFCIDSPVFRASSQKKVESAIIDEIKNIDPDVIILDMRLVESDHDSTQSHNYTGIRLLKMIKEEINKGIQVIGFTASNKVWNYLEWSDNGQGIDDIIVKESPELSDDESYTTNSMKHLEDGIRKGIERASFLKNVDAKFKAIQPLISATDIQFYEDVKHNFVVAYELIKSYKVDKKYVAYAYLQMFQILENYLDLLTEWDGDDYILYHDNLEYRLLSKKTGSKECDCAMKNDGRGNFSFGKETYLHNRNFIEANFKMSAYLIYVFGCNKIPASWMDIRSTRNKVVHDSYNPKENEFIKLLKYLEFFFDSSKINPRSESDALGLPIPSNASNTLGNLGVLQNMFSKN